jgi:hypothetical protein
MSKKQIDQLKSRVQTLENSTHGLVGDIAELKLLAYGEQVVKENFTTDLDAVKSQVTKLLKETDLPDWAEWVIAQRSGYICVNENEPCISCHAWHDDKIGNARAVGILNLNGADWSKCIWKISDLIGEVKTKPDWENLLTETDINIVFPANMEMKQDKYLTTYLNRIIHERIKPLLDEIEFYKKLSKERVSQIHEARKRIAELEKEYNLLQTDFELFKFMENIVWYSEDKMHSSSTETMYRYIRLLAYKHTKNALVDIKR